MRPLSSLLRANCPTVRPALFGAPLRLLHPIRNLTTTLPKHRFQVPKSKQKVAAMPSEMTTKTGEPFVRDNLEGVMKRRRFYKPAFDIYGGVKGLYDAGYVFKSLKNSTYE